MLLLGTRPACNAAMNEDHENLSRGMMQSSRFFCVKFVEGEVEYRGVKQSGKSRLYEH